jgi:hypothetical protein
MTHQDVQNLELNKDEMSLIARLLESRQKELLSEVRHTDHRSYREKLMDELEMVDRLLVRIPVEKEQEAR